MDEPSTPTDERHGRRSVLRALGAAAVGTTTGLAGCNDVTSYEFTATPAGLSEAGMRRGGFPESHHEPVTVTRRPSMGGVGVEVTVTSHLVTYRHDQAAETEPGTDWSIPDPIAESVGVLATPEADIGGTKHNPLATQPLGELIAGDRGRQILHRAGVARDDEVHWRRAPTKVRESDATLLGTGAAFETYAGVLAGDADHADRVLLAHLVRTAHDGDAVLVAVAQWRTVPDTYDDGELVAPDGDGVMTTEDVENRAATGVQLVDPVIRDPPVNAAVSIPRLGVSDFRLVQRVEDTVVYEKHSGTERLLHEEPDPPLVAGDNAAPVFDLSGTNLDELPESWSGESTVWFTLTLVANGRPTVERFYLEAETVREIVNGSAPTLRVLENESHNWSGDHGLPVFEINEDLDAAWLEVNSRGVLGQPLPPRIERGPQEDFTVETVSPLRVAFVEVVDPDEGKNYGYHDGGCLSYSTTSPIEYLRSVFPGPLTAFRFERPYVGSSKQGWDGYAHDFKWAWKYANYAAARGAGTLSRLGQFETTATTEQAATKAIKKAGFDVVVTVVPGDTPGNRGAKGYFDYHKESVSGLALFTTDAAVAALEPGDHRIDRTGYVGTVAQEIAHQFENDPYDQPTPDRPMAQRDDDGAELTGVERYGPNNTDPAGIDLDHARERRSNHDEDVHSDLPAVLSTCYDLSDGEFDLVEGWQVGSGGTRPQTERRGEIVQLHSFMSYNRYDHDGENWTDARIERRLTTEGFEAEQGSGSLSTITVQGHADEDGGVVIDSVEVGPGYPTRQAGETDNSVTVEFRSPAGEVVDTAGVPETTEVTHGEGPDRPTVLASLPLPETAAEVVVVRDGVESRVDPVTRPLTEAFGRLPATAIDSNATAFRETVDETLDHVATLTAEGEYGRAAAVLDGELRARVRESVRDDYEAALNQPTRTDLTTRLDDASGRLRTLATA